MAKTFLEILKESDPNASVGALTIAEHCDGLEDINETLIADLKAARGEKAEMLEALEELWTTDSDWIGEELSQRVEAIIEREKAAKEAQNDD